jgi:hypothetical protein
LRLTLDQEVIGSIPISSAKIKIIMSGLELFFTPDIVTLCCAGIVLTVGIVIFVVVEQEQNKYRNKK